MTLPKWLYSTLPLWQYANMETARIGYYRLVANDDEPPHRIEELMEAAGLNQAELARRANVTASSLNKVIKGTRGLDLDWMIRLARALSTEEAPVSPADLLPRSVNPWLLDEEERALIDARRHADQAQRETFKRVAEAVLPFRERKQEDAA
ncbi:transcriptional regulator with XRE-family HTH domain [Sphingomonas trueperi]|uniref:Transcriptional regulator with XRE-family HTH domain n=1 Tax=Sphingomonas trueperi TaxID=53317 RepID=A0A7X6BEP5_9SPHN|nr:transcriptional regulator with XRE-family HTH domain [Sphingomonas trueperi]